MRKTNHSVRSNKTSKKKEKANNYFEQQTPLDEEMADELEEDQFEEEVQLIEPKPPVPTAGQKKKRRINSQENLSAKQEYDSQED